MKQVTITQSVGKLGVNLAPDVAAITAALVAVGSSRGGTQWPASSRSELEKAIENFQKHEMQYGYLKIVDGRIDPHGSTLRRINAYLGGDNLTAPPTPGGGVGTLTFLPSRAELPEEVTTSTAKTPIEDSLIRDFLFDWTVVVGHGRIHYFQLTENVVPKWYGVLVPDNTVSFNNVHLFFHPTPGQAGYQTSTYYQLGNWYKIFRYLWQQMGAAFCAAATGRVMIMPLMTDGVSVTCGILPQRWEELFSQMLSMVQADEGAPFGSRVTISSMIVSSFSSGITYSHYFRQRANLGSRLAGVIDFDGLYSTNRNLCVGLLSPGGRVVKAQQMIVKRDMITQLAAQNIFPFSRERMKPPYEKKTPHEIHAAIPHFMMYIAAKRLH